MKYILRKCDKSDLSELINLCELHASYEKTNYDPNGKVENLEKALFQEPSKLFCEVVEIENKLIGYVSYTIDFSTWNASYYLHLDCIFLLEEYRGNGIGKYLMKHICNKAKENNCQEIQWQTPFFNTKAINFYKKVGGIGKEKVRFNLPL